MNKLLPVQMLYNQCPHFRGGSRGGAKGAQAPPSSPKHLKAPPSSSNATKCLKQIFNIFTHFRDDFNDLVHKDKYYC